MHKSRIKKLNVINESHKSQLNPPKLTTTTIKIYTVRQVSTYNYQKKNTKIVKQQK